MTHATGSRAAACVLFNLPDRCVLDAIDLPDGRRRVLIEHTSTEAGCPTCGALSRRVRQRTHQHLREVPITGAAGDLEVVLVKRRFACTERLCPRRTFVDVSDQVPLRAHRTTRLRVAVLDAVVAAGRVVAEVASAHALSWWTVMKAVNAAALVLTEPDDVPLRRLGIDEHSYEAPRIGAGDHVVVINLRAGTGTPRSWST